MNDISNTIYHVQKNVFYIRHLVLISEEIIKSDNKIE